MIEPQPGYSQRNEFEHRDEIERELAQKHDKRADIVVPYGKKLQFTGLNGEEVTLVFNEDGAFTIDTGTGGIVKFAGDLSVTGAITVGEVRWPVALQPAYFYPADGESIEWAGGAALSQVPDYTILIPGGVALAAGEAWEPPTLQSVSTTGATLRLKISTPGATSAVTDTTDAAGGVGDPERVMAKADSADAYNGVYNFRIQGTLTITSINEGGFYSNEGDMYLSTWFNDGGGWDEGPTLWVNAATIGIPYTSSISYAGSQAFDITVAVAWANAVGQHGGYEWGLTRETSGGTITDFVSVTYTKQSTSGVRTGSPNGEVATVIVTPKNLA